MAPLAEIFSQGEEIVTGQTVDSNAAWLSQRLVEMGFRVVRHTAVGDNLDDLAALLQEIASRADCCICTGGLGPTLDDLTAAAVSKAFSLPLLFDAEAYRQIKGYFVARNRVMPDINRKQAMLPQGAQRLDNVWGTAPGFALRAQRCRFAFVPGVPYEMRQMFDTHIAPWLEGHFHLRSAKLVTIKTVGIGESDIQQRLTSLVLPAGVLLGFRAATDEVQTKLLFPPDYSAEELQTIAAEAAKLIGNTVFAIDFFGSQTTSLADVLDGLLQTSQQTLAVAETASHGMIAAKCAGRPWLLESIYTDSLERLCRRWDIACGGVAEETAVQLAQALRIASGADLGLLQWYSGHAAEFSNKDTSIILHHVVADAKGLRCGAAATAGPWHRKQNQAALLALDFLRRYLQA